MYNYFENIRKFYLFWIIKGLVINYVFIYYIYYMRMFFAIMSKFIHVRRLEAYFQTSPPKKNGASIPILGPNLKSPYRTDKHHWTLNPTTGSIHHLRSNYMKSILVIDSGDLSITPRYFTQINHKKLRNLSVSCIFVLTLK